MTVPEITDPPPTSTKAKWAFDGKVALVTGGARGIGRTIATAFGKAGAQVAIGDLNVEASEKTAMELRQQGMAAEHFIVDLSKKGEPQRLIDSVAKRFGRLDFLINNARAGARLGFLDESEGNWDLTLSVGLRAAFFAAQQAIPLMTSGGGGSIVNISSVAALQVSLESGGYHAAKAGLVQLTKYLAANAGAQGVRVNSVLPGFIIQDEHQDRYQGIGNATYRARAEGCHPLRSVGSASDVAEAVLFLCSDSSKFITGHEIVVDGGFTVQDAWTVIASMSDNAGKS